MLEQHSIHAFIQKHGIKTETGEPLDFRDHLYLFEPYRDTSPKLVILKAAQIGFSTLAIIKSFWISMMRGLAIIYTLPTEDDRNDFVSSKVNKIIATNPIFQTATKDKDAVEQKQLGNSTIFYRGTWTKKAAIMVSSDLNIYDEVDASKQDVIEQYATRLQASKYKWEWYFSHPSASGTGVDKYWQLSDMKHWFIKCAGCLKEQYMSWPESIDADRKVFQCKYCKKELGYEERRVGRWRKMKGKENAEFSGYWMPLFIRAGVKAEEILAYHRDKTEEYFTNYVLGMPYVGSGNKLTWGMLAPNLTEEIITPDTEERIVIGIDTGKNLDYVMGSENGLFFHGEAKSFDEIEIHMKRWPRAIAIVDGGGDMLATRAFHAKYPGRVFLCFLRGTDKKSVELVDWGDGDEHGKAQADRNRLIQLVVDEFRGGRIPLQGTQSDWYDYWMDWNNLTRIKEIDSQTGAFKGFKWVRNGRDHRALATCFWRVGMMRFGGVGSVSFGNVPSIKPNSYELDAEGKVPAKDIFALAQFEREETDWRDV